jgi:hypothetical protein
VFIHMQGVAAEKNNNEKYEAYEHASRKYEPTVQKNESKIAKCAPLLSPTECLHF